MFDCNGATNYRPFLNMICPAQLLVNVDQRIKTYLMSPHLPEQPHEMAYLQPLQLEMDITDAMQGVPIIAIMLVPPNISRVVSYDVTAGRSNVLTSNMQVVNLQNSGRERRAGMGSSTSPPKNTGTLARDGLGEREYDPQAKRLPPTRETNDVAGTKRPYEADVSVMPAEGDSKRARTLAEAGPSSLKIVGKPQYVPGSDKEVLLVLPPIPKSIYEELTDDSLTEPESSEGEREIRKRDLTRDIVDT